jgi:uncharacterized protein (TIGR03437 family)
VEAIATAVKRPSLVRTDEEGRVYVAGNIDSHEAAATPGAYSSPPRAGQCGAVAWRYQSDNPAQDIQVARLRPRTLELEYAAVLGGECGSEPVSLDVSDDQRVTIGFATQAQAFDQRAAVASAGFCRGYDLGTGVAQLSADGSQVIRSTMLDGCQAIAVTTAGSDVYAVSADNAPDALIVRVPGEVAAGPRVDRVSNALSGTGFGIAPGELLAIHGEGLGPVDPVDLGLNPERDLPVELGGTQVWINGIPAPVLRAGADRVIVVAPENLEQGSAAIEVVREGARSNEVVVRVLANMPAVLPLSFPIVTPGALQHANARNEDGSLNTPANPARAGSTVWVFATGLGATQPQAPAGTVATIDAIRPATEFRDGGHTPIAGIRSMRGFLTSLFAVPLVVPPTIPVDGRLRVSLTTTTTWRGTSRRSFSAPAFVYVK